MTNAVNVASLGSAMSADSSNNVSVTTGNLTFSSTGQRIIGDFTNATIANRAGFQTSTTNGSTGVVFAPNGTGTVGGIACFNNSDVANSSTASFRASGSLVEIISSITGTGSYLPMTFYTGGSEKMRIDTSGNLGLGVTPSTWSTGKSLEVGSLGNSFYGYSQTNNLVTQNCYYNAGWKYASSNYAGAYSQNAGTHAWLIAPSGTAGNAITFTQAMTLDANQNLAVTNGNTNAMIGFNAINDYFTPGGGSSTAQYGISRGSLGSNTLGVSGYSGVGFYTNSAERMRIDSSGNVQLSTANTSILNSSGRKILNQTGGVLQVVSGTLTTCVSTTSTSYVDTGVTVTITPSSTSSKILVKVCLNNISKNDAGLVGFNLTRNGTTVVYNTTTGTGSTYQAWATIGGFNNNRLCVGASLIYFDSPATTSACTYKVQIKVEGGTGYLNQWGLNTDASAVSSITVMEIAQ
jgi:hypothetical protein